MNCKAYLVAESIQIKALPSEKRLREVAFLTVKDNTYVVFPYGVVVCWGDGALADLLVVINQHLDEPFPHDKMLIDEFEVKLNAAEGSKLVFEDTINLPEFDDLTVIALSHSIAQSLRLEQHEATIQESIQKVKHIPENLMKYGKIKESKRKISKIQGHLYYLKGKINFEHSILDKPEFFWEYPEYDPFYNRMTEYLELQQRINVLNSKVRTVDEILSILSDELNHRHSSKLEIIIILLIMIEIVIFFLKDIFKLI